MKRKIILLAILFLALLVNAQKSEYAYIKNSWWYFDMTYTSKTEKEKIADAKISGYAKTFKNKKKEHVESQVTYDNKGNCISLIYYKKNGKTRSQYLYTYSPENKILSKTYSKEQGKEMEKFIFNFDTLGNRKDEAYYKKEQIKAKTISKYDSTKIIESYYYKNGSADYNRKWLYTYYPDKSKKSSVIYNAKGKIIHTWNYECKPEGELQAKHKDTTDVCKKVETDSSGNKTVTERKFDEKGKAIRIVYVYDKEEVLIQYATYNSKDMCTYSFKCIPGSLNLQEVIYYRKGKENYKYHYMYDSSHNLISTMGYHKGEQVNHSEYQYNAQGFVTSFSWYRKKNSLYSTHTYKYSYL
ncbi:MAG: hypothetical protein V1904_03590 [Bacteroidota bacterium]